MNETEFFQWVRRIQALHPTSSDTSSSGSSADEEAGLDFTAAFRVFDRDQNGYITKVGYNLLTFLFSHLSSFIHYSNIDWFQIIYRKSSD